MKKYIAIMMSCIAIVTPFFAYAALGLSDYTRPKNNADTRAPMPDQGVPMREKAREMKEKVNSEIRGRVSEMQGEIKSEMKEKMGALQKEMMERRDAMREEMSKKREEFQAKAEERRAALKKKVGEERANNIERFFATMTEKFEDALDRLGKVADRLDERIQASGASAAEVKGWQDKLTAARAKIAEANTALADAKIKYAEAIKSTDLKIAFQKVRTIVQATADKVETTHQALREVTAAVKGSMGMGQDIPSKDAGASPVPAQ